MNSIRSARVIAGLTLGALAASLPHTLQAQGANQTPQSIQQFAPGTYPGTDSSAFQINSTKLSSTLGADKQMVTTYQSDVKITPIIHEGVSAPRLTIEQGQGVLILKSTTAQGVSTALGQMAFDAAGQTVTVRDGITTYRDKEGRTLQILPPHLYRAPEPILRYNNDVIQNSHLYLLGR